MMGLGSACDTLFAQTFGSTNKFRVGVILQRSLIIMVLCGLPCWAVLMNTEHLLIVLGQNNLVARQAGKYAVVYIAALPGQVIAIVLAKYLQSQSIVMPSMIIAIVTNLINLGLHALFLSGLHFGIMGAALSVALTQWLIVLLTVLYIVIRRRYTDTWGGWTMECFDEWGLFFSLALPGLFMVCLEWWTFEILFFIVGTLGVVPLASHTIAYNAAALAFMIPLGLSVASSVCVGNHLGANEPKKAATAARVAIMLSFIASIIIALLTLAVNRIMPLIFTDDSAVVDLASKLLMVSALFELFNCAQGALCGVIRGVGNQIFGAVTNFISYYVVALPLCIPVLLLTDIGVYGAWWGVIVSSALQAIAYFFKIFRTDWEKEAKNAQNRSGVTDGEVPSDNFPVITMNDLSGSKARLIDEDFLANGGKSKNYGVLSNDEYIELPNGKQSSLSGTQNQDSQQKDNKNQNGKRTFVYRLILIMIFVAILAAGVAIKLHFDQFLESDEVLCSVNRVQSCGNKNISSPYEGKVNKTQMFDKYHPQTFG
ncbi:multidrug and toxin extrusion protein 2-like [Argopecten irradians]|uniref:multidrug and toxin extrusion protein 2-like n=1 Tax=Argopecten irradians TaxID=31199 RepID=UPI003711BC28